MSRSAVACLASSTTLFSQTLASGGGSMNNISVTVQNPSSSADSVEIAWDDVDTALVAGTGQILAPGDWRTIKSFPVNAAGKVGILGISLGATVNLRLMSSASVL